MEKFIGKFAQMSRDSRKNANDYLAMFVIFDNRRLVNEWEPIEENERNCFTTLLRVHETFWRMLTNFILQTVSTNNSFPIVGA